MARARRKGDGRKGKGGRGKRRKESGSWARRRVEVSFEMAAPAACTNEPEPLCVAMKVVIAELLASSGMAGPRLAQCTNLSRQTIWNLQWQKSDVDMKTAAIVGRAFFFCGTELMAIAEELARETSTRMD